MTDMPNTTIPVIESINLRKRIVELEAKLEAKLAAPSLDPRMVALKSTRIKVDDEYEFTLWELLEYWEKRDA